MDRGNSEKKEVKYSCPYCGAKVRYEGLREDMAELFYHAKDILKEFFSTCYAEAREGAMPGMENDKEYIKGLGNDIARHKNINSHDISPCGVCFRTLTIGAWIDCGIITTGMIWLAKNSGRAHKKVAVDVVEHEKAF